MFRFLRGGWRGSCLTSLRALRGRSAASCEHHATRWVSNRSNSCFRWVPSASAMDLRQLSALIAVAEGGGISAAARSLHTVQSNISTHLARLERELGSPVRPARAASSPRRARRGRAGPGRSRRSSTPWTPTWRRCATRSPARSASGASAPRPLARAARAGGGHRGAPKVHVIVVDATTTSLVPRLLADELDLAVVNLPVANPEVSTEPLFDEDRLLLAPKATRSPAWSGRPCRARRPRAPARAERHRVPRRARPRGRGGRHRAARQGGGRRPPTDRHPRVPGVRGRHRAGHRGARVAGGELATRAHRRARPTLGGAGSALRGLLPAPARALREAVLAWWPRRGRAPMASTRRRNRHPRGSQPPHDPHRPRRVRSPGVALAEITTVAGRRSCSSR